MSPFNFRDVLGVESLGFKQLFTQLAVKQQAPHCQLTQYQSHYFAHVHARNHLFKPTLTKHSSSIPLTSSEYNFLYTVLIISRLSSQHRKD